MTYAKILERRRRWKRLLTVPPLLVACYLSAPALYARIVVQANIGTVRDVLATSGIGYGDDIRVCRFAEERESVVLCLDSENRLTPPNVERLDPDDMRYDTALSIASRSCDIEKSGDPEELSNATWEAAGYQHDMVGVRSGNRYRIYLQRLRSHNPPSAQEP